VSWPTPSNAGPKTAQLRELVDARNELDAVAYQVERRLGESVPVHEKARAETLVAPPAKPWRKRPRSTSCDPSGLRFRTHIRGSDR
jgi:hypothetical protein